MELIICFGLAVSVFSLVIALIVGLVSAPTPILLGILVIGMMFTQKSIDKLTTSDTNVVEEKNREKIEKVELEKTEGNGLFRSMIYRGSNYNSPEQTALNIPKKNIQYRGVKSNHSPSDIV
ncbi:hypothetical protein A5482_014040 [Cyanobacterium sp. IPPAS B-1200]|uniref:hypothetical protein n=1 Tax=Cyanobacterium sp. IPPAS B-1200 TaxID=1562720 RepID=UPI0008525D13|nr:hypothetical protein [Cyanobacterium sp. IPPAS B-1200]OEJ78518.1 hypothetical protein A5482_12750 [Cyanobacterium sp. IPPAS B-1200]